MTKLSQTMIDMLVDAMSDTNGILRGNGRTMDALVNRGLAEHVRNPSGIVHVYLTEAGKEAGRPHLPAVEPVEDIVTVTEIVSQADTTPVDLVTAAEAAREAHYANAISTDRCAGPVYEASKAALMAAIRAAYPDVNADEVHYHWVANNESIAYNVALVREWRALDIAEDNAEPATTRTVDDVRRELTEVIGACDSARDIDTVSLVDAIVKNYGTGPVANIPGEEFWAVVAEHDRTQQHMVIGPRRELTRDFLPDSGSVSWWNRTIGGHDYRFVLGVNANNGAVCATVTRVGTNERIRIIPLRKPTEVSVSPEPGSGQPPVVTPPSLKIHIGTFRESCASHGCPGCPGCPPELVSPQPPVVTLPPRTIPGGMRTVPFKRSRRAHGWRKAGKR